MTDSPLSVAQQRSIAQSNGFINIWSGAIRSGKTVASLLRWAHYVPKAPRGGVLVVTGKTLDTIHRNVFAPLSDPFLLGRGGRLTRWTRGAPTGMIMGREVEVISGNDARAEERLRGLTCAGWYGDELSLLPEQFVDQLIGRCSVPGAMGFGTSNPGAPGHWLRKRYILAAWKRDGPGVRHWAFGLDDNPALTPEYIAAIKALYVGMWYKRMILGLWVMAEGAIFDMFDPDKHVCSTLPASMRWLATGTDYGTSNPFASLLLGVGAHPGEPARLWVAREWRHESKLAGRQMTDAEYSTAIDKWLTEVEISPGVKGVRPEWEVVDPSAASYRIQRHRDGATTYPGDNSVDDGLRSMASLFGRDLLRVHESCVGLINELPGYSWDDKAALKGIDQPIKTDDHSIDGTRYAIRTTEPMWYHLVGATQSNGG